MGRLQDPKRAESRRVEVAEATLRTIAKYGIEGASLRTIAREAGVTTGTLVYHFRNKQEILLFAGRTVLQGVVSRIRKAVEDSPTLDTLELALLAELPATAEKRMGWTIWLAFTAQAAAIESFRTEHEERYAELRSVLHKCLDAEKQSGSLLSDIDTAAEVRRILGTFDGLGLHSLLEPELYPSSYQKELFSRSISNLKQQ